MRLAMRSLALRARLFIAISLSVGVISPPTFLNGTDTLPNQSFSGVPSNCPSRIKRFTARSSSE